MFLNCFKMRRQQKYKRPAINHDKKEPPHFRSKNQCVESDIDNHFGGHWGPSRYIKCEVVNVLLVDILSSGPKKTNTNL